MAYGMHGTGNVINIEIRSRHVHVIYNNVITFPYFVMLEIDQYEPSSPLSV